VEDKVVAVIDPNQDMSTVFEISFLGEICQATWQGDKTNYGSNGREKKPEQVFTEPKRLVRNAF
jgi:hypothetical protein